MGYFAQSAAGGGEPGAVVSSDRNAELLDDQAAWGICSRAVSDMRREPRSLAERVSQALMGDVLRVLEESGEWTRVRLEHDGYLGWMRSGAIHLCSRQEAESYKKACQVQVLEGLLPARLEAKTALGLEAGRLPFGVRLPVEKRLQSSTQVRLPDGRLWWVDSTGLLPAEAWPAPTPAGVSFTLALMRSFIGIPYLWGGRSPYGFDCSGLSGSFWNFLGVHLPRDADQQYEAGEPVTGALEPGDLLFFGRLSDEKPDERQLDRFGAITHVAISLGGREVIHANSSAGGVSVNSIDPGASHYSAWLYSHFTGARRNS